jgi:hypothetical protein
MAKHRWSGWPGAWCLDCGCADPDEVALAEGRDEVSIDPALLECPDPGSGRFDPYKGKERISLLNLPWDKGTV